MFYLLPQYVDMTDYYFEITDRNLLNIIINGDVHYYSYQTLLKARECHIDNPTSIEKTIINEGISFFNNNVSIVNFNSKIDVPKSLIIEVLGLENKDYEDVFINFERGVVGYTRKYPCSGETFALEDFVFNYLSNWSRNLKKAYTVEYTINIDEHIKLGNSYDARVESQEGCEAEYYHDPYDLVGYMLIGYIWIYNNR